MNIESPEDIVGLQSIGKIVALTIETMRKQIRSGITTRELDRIGEKVLKEHGAQSAPQLVYQFPGATCISVNEEAAHGIPSDRVLHRGDLINIDVSAEKAGYYADSGATFFVEAISQQNQRLLDATQHALKSAMNVARHGNNLNMIGKTIADVANEYGFKTLRDLSSHGVGRHLHEAPEYIPNFYDKRDKRKLKEGMVITIEPFLSTGSEYTETAKDGWTLISGTNNLTAQFEHTMIITKEHPMIMTQL